MFAPCKAFAAEWAALDTICGSLLEDVVNEAVQHLYTHAAAPWMFGCCKAFAHQWAAIESCCNDIIHGVVTEEAHILSLVDRSQRCHQRVTNRAELLRQPDHCDAVTERTILLGPRRNKPVMPTGWESKMNKTRGTPGFGLAYNWHAESKTLQWACPCDFCTHKHPAAPWILGPGGGFTPEWAALRTLHGALLQEIVASEINQIAIATYRLEVAFLDSVILDELAKFVSRALRSNSARLQNIRDTKDRQRMMPFGRKAQQRGKKRKGAEPRLYAGTNIPEHSQTPALVSLRHGNANVRDCTFECHRTHTGTRTTLAIATNGHPCHRFEFTFDVDGTAISPYVVIDGTIHESRVLANEDAELEIRWMNEGCAVFSWRPSDGYCRFTLRWMCCCCSCLCACWR